MPKSNQSDDAMRFDNFIHDQSPTESDIPVWLKVAVAVSVAGILGVVAWALSSAQVSLFGIAMGFIQKIALGCLLLLSSLLIGFWFYPNSVASRLIYWMLRSLQEQFNVLSLFGVVYLAVRRVEFLSLRGSVLYGSLAALFLMGWRLKPTSLESVPHPALETFFSRLRRGLAKIEHIPTWILRVIVSLLPVAVVCAVIYLVFGSSLARYGPHSFWNDEISYWIWLRSFVFTGFRSGYNSANELLPIFEFSRYGEASPFYLYIYGELARLITWFPAVPILINFFLLTVAIFLFLRVLKFDGWQTIFSGLAILSTWPVLIYLPLTTHETLNQVIGILSAAVFIRLLRERDSIHIGARLSLILFIYAATLVRLSWGLLLMPVWFYALKGKLWQRAVLSLILGGLMYASVILLMGYMLPQVNNTILGTFEAGWIEGPRIILDKVLTEFASLFKSRQLNPNIGVVFQFVVVAGWSCYHIGARLHSRSAVAAVLEEGGLFDFYATLSLLAAGVAFYLSVAFYRTFAAVLLMMFLLLAARRDYKKLSALLAINVLLFSSYMTFFYGIGDYRIVAADYTMPNPWRGETNATLEKLIVYDPDAANPWCNTLLIPLSYYDSRLMLAPPGIGISYILNPETYRPPIRSRYVLIDSGGYEKYKEGTHLELLASLPVGVLYLNRDVECQPKP